MDPSVREIVLLGLLCAFLCGVALMYEQQLVAAVFAVLGYGKGPGRGALPITASLA
jgi:hypothetical protein